MTAASRLTPWLVCLGLALLMASTRTDASVRVSVNGVEGEVRDNVLAFIDADVDLDSELAARFYQDRTRRQVQEALEALGYYQAAIALELEPVQGDWVLSADIEPGPRITVRAVAIRISGDAADDEAFAALRERLPLESGQGLDHGDYQSSKRALRNLAIERGYFDYRFSQAELAIDVDEGWTDVTLELDSGDRYMLGEVGFSSVPLRASFLQRLVPFAPGAPYSAERVAELNRRLLESGYFDDAVVDTRREAAEGERIPVEANVGMRDRNTVSTGLGYSTDEGPRVRLGFTRHYVNNRGHSLTSEVRASPVNQGVNARYRIPLGDPLNDNLSVNAGWDNEEVDDQASERYAFGLSRRQEFTSGWVRTQSVRYLDERFSAGEDSGRSALLMPGLSFSRTRSRGGIDPFRGDYQHYSIEGSARALGSDVDIARLRLGNTWLRSIGRAHRFQLRADLGGIATNDFDDVPTSLRFFAGGDQSVRGFSYRSLGPTDAGGEVTGGRYLATGSAEYSYAVRGNWRLALFADAGNAFDGPDELDPEVGTGFGLRWGSPVGPLRVDIAWGVSRDDIPVRLHLSVGPPF
ncbi:autotransporter assembly complex protein TamA [Spiribacter salinus]|uniref:autotransporter assembly complex protein TamA n=1 Tax=Spiribacter salinus TaxID=1335746 RepID=UPI001C9553D5|nr:autotransporter assembly complex family protein [Spiribacter salinus]